MIFVDALVATNNFLTLKVLSGLLTRKYVLPSYPSLPPPSLLRQAFCIFTYFVVGCLHRFKYEVTEAENGALAVEKCEEHNYSIIFLELDMPGMIASEE